MLFQSLFFQITNSTIARLYPIVYMQLQVSVRDANYKNQKSHENTKTRFDNVQTLKCVPMMVIH